MKSERKIVKHKLFTKIALFALVLWFNLFKLQSKFPNSIRIFHVLSDVQIIQNYRSTFKDLKEFGKIFLKI